MLKNSKFRSSLGLTLLEAMLALSILAYASVGRLNETVNEIRNTESKIFGQDLAKMVYAVDRRLSVDGVATSEWDTLSWPTENDVINDLFARQLVGYNNPGCGMPTGWAPSDASAQRVALVPCNFYSAKSIPYELNVSAGIESVSTDVDTFYFDFRFPDDARFEEYFKHLIKAVATARANDSPGLKGGHNYQFVNATTLTPYATTVDCFNARSNCMLRVTMETGAGASGDYLKVDGTNEMEAEINFRNSGGIQQCTGWKNTSGATSTWALSTAADNFNCGIIGGNGTTDVQVVANQVTGEEIVLDSLCNVRQKGTSGTNSNRYQTTGTTIPCGMSQDGGIVTVATESVMAQNAYITEVVTNNVITRGVTSHGDISLKTDTSSPITNILMENDTGRIMAEGYIEAGEASESFFGQVRLMRIGLRGITTDATAANNGSIYLQPAGGRDLNILPCCGMLGDRLYVANFDNKYETYKNRSYTHTENAGSRIYMQAGTAAGVNDSRVYIFASNTTDGDNGLVDIRASSGTSGDNGTVNIRASQNGNNGQINLLSSSNGAGGEINMVASGGNGEVYVNADEIEFDGNVRATTSTMGVQKGSWWDSQTGLGYGQRATGDRRRFVTKDYVDSTIRLIDLLVVRNGQWIPKPTAWNSYGNAAGCDRTTPLIVLTPISMYTYSYDNSGKVNDCRANTAAANYRIYYSFNPAHYKTVPYVDRYDHLGRMRGRGFYPARMRFPTCDKVKNDLVYTQYAVSSGGSWVVRMYLTGWGGRTSFGGRSIAHIYCDKIRNHP